MKWVCDICGAEWSDDRGESEGTEIVSECDDCQSSEPRLGGDAMTIEEINRKIAEACYSVCKACNGTRKFNYTGEEITCENCNPKTRKYPDYCSDLNAMAEAESLLNTTDNQFSKWCDYYDNLLAITAGTFDRNIEADCRSLLHATAMQRALAFLKTVAPKL